MKIKSGILVVSLLLFSVFAYSGGNAQSVSQSEGMLCHVSDAVSKSEKYDHQAMMAKGVVAIAQDTDNPNQKPDPDQSHDTPTHRWSPGDGCSSVNPNAPNKKRDGVKQNTVGCKCTKKCVNGQTQEDMSKDEKDVYICKNASHKDRCSCPDPCKS